MRSLRIHSCVAALALAAVFCMPLAVSAQTYNIHFNTPDVTGKAGGLITVGIGLDNQPGDVTAFSFGVKHDKAFLTLDSVDMAAELQSIIGAGETPDDRFYSVDESPAGGDGFTVGLILSGDDATSTVIPAGLGHKIYSARYRIAAEVTGTTTIDITGRLGNPAVPVVFDLSGVSQAPVGDSPVPVTTATVTDAILILDYLVGGSRLPAGEPTRTNCKVAMNVNGDIGKGDPAVEDDRDIDLTDPIVLLQYIFDTVAGAPPPAEPFPGCGQPLNVVADSISCNVFDCD